MTEMVTVPGVGPVKKPMLVGVVAVGAGVVGYAWWQKGRQASTAAVAPNPDLIGDVDRTPVVGDSTGSWDTTTGNATIDTNGEWTQAATEYLVNLGGYEAGAVSAALGKFLGHQPLTEAEVQIVLAAKGAFGDPPIGGPWPVTTGLPAPGGSGSTTAPAAVTGLRVQPDVRANDIVWTHDGKNVTHFFVQATVRASGSQITAKVGAYPLLNQYVWRHNLAGGINQNYTVDYLVVPWNNDVMGPARSVASNFRMS